MVFNWGEVCHPLIIHDSCGSLTTSFFFLLLPGAAAALFARLPLPPPLSLGSAAKMTMTEKTCVSRKKTETGDQKEFSNFGVSTQTFFFSFSLFLSPLPAVRRYYYFHCAKKGENMPPLGFEQEILVYGDTWSFGTGGV